MRHNKPASARRKTLQRAKTVPRFDSSEAAAQFFESHDVGGVEDGLKAVRAFRLPPEQTRKIQQRHARRKTAISIRLQPEQINAAKQIAARKSIGYQTQLRLWIAEGIGREEGIGKRA